MLLQHLLLFGIIYFLLFISFLLVPECKLYKIEIFSVSFSIKSPRLGKMFVTAPKRGLMDEWMNEWMKFCKDWAKFSLTKYQVGYPGGSEVKNSSANAEDTGSVPGWGRSPGGENGNLLQYSCLENPMDRGAWPAIVHGVTRELVMTVWAPPWYVDKTSGGPFSSPLHLIMCCF